MAIPQGMPPSRPSASPEQSGASGPSRGHLLDKLPADVCERLVLHVTGGQPTPEGLSLARTSPKLRDAILAIVGHHLHLPNRVVPSGASHGTVDTHAPWAVKWLKDSDFAGAWLELLKDSIMEFTAETKYSKRLTIVEEVLKSPSLRKVTLFDKRTLFAAIGQSRSIRELTVSFRSKKYGPGLFDALARMNVEKLCFDCRACHTARSCPFQDATLFNSNYNAIAVSCPNLTSLQMWCTVISGDDDRDGSNAPVWRIFPEIPSLKELIFNGEAPDQAIPKLRELESVQLSWAERAYDLAMRIGMPITGLGTHNPFDDEMVRGLTSCPRLKELAIDLKAGAECALADTFRGLPSLSKVSLQWGIREECEHGQHEQHNCYVDAIPGAVYSAMRAAPNLTSIHLADVRLPLAEMEDILIGAGERLEEVCVSVDDQDESPIERLRTLLLTAAKSNAGLREFEIRDLEPLTLQPDADIEWEAPSLIAAVERLKRHAPRLNAIRLQNYINCALLDNGTPT